MIYPDYPDIDETPSLMRRRDRTFAFRDSADAPLQFVIAPAETLSPGDTIVLDREKGWLRKATPEDTGQKFTVPPGSRVNGRGYLEIPQRPIPTIADLVDAGHLPAFEMPRKGELAKRARESRATRCTEIADQVVPAYRAENARHTGCTSHTAKRWQAAWDAACIALGGDPKEYLG